MTNRITNDTNAIEWLKEHEPNTVINENNTVTVTKYCGRCGGTGRYGWQGVCWACNGRNSRTVTYMPVKKYAQQEKARYNRNVKKASQRQAQAERRREAILEGQRDWCEKNGYGRITFAEKKQLQKEYRDKMNASKVFIGDLGMKIDLEVTFMYSINFETSYGVMYIYKFEDEARNTLIWKTSINFRRIDDKINRGSTVRLKGTIKEHNVYKGEKQTVLTRCKVTKA